jgi:hypothetical protein
MGLDWVGAVANAVSLAVGVSVGSLITFYLTKREMKKTVRAIKDSDAVKEFTATFRLIKEFLESSEAKGFVKRLNVILDKLGSGETVKEELIKIPEG